MKLTRSIKKDEIKKEWYLVDAQGIRLGQLATHIARLLIGKHKVERADYLPSGDSVVVINASKLDVFHKKLKQKKYYRHSGYIGNLKEQTLGDLMKKFPHRVVEKAVKGMLPKTKIGRKLIKNLYVYDEAVHPHEGQEPQVFKIK